VVVVVFVLSGVKLELDIEERGELEFVKITLTTGEEELDVVCCTESVFEGVCELLLGVLEAGIPERELVLVAVTLVAVEIVGDEECV